MSKAPKNLDGKACSAQLPTDESEKTYMYKMPSKIDVHSDSTKAIGSMTISSTNKKRKE